LDYLFVSAPIPQDRKNGAGDGVRTRDLKLGKLALYQLSYTRISCPHARVDIWFLSRKMPFLWFKRSSYLQQAMLDGNDLLQ
jgi:hypothetical protein